MSTSGVATRHDGTIELTGPLTFETVPELLQQSAGWFAAGGATDAPGGPVRTLDLVGVTRVDSAGLALLLEWRRLAGAAGDALHFAKAPEQMRHLIRVSGLQSAFVLD